MIKKRYLIISFTLVIMLLATFTCYNIFAAKSEILGNVSIFNKLGEKSDDSQYVNKEVLGLKEIDEETDEKNQSLENVFVKQSDIVISDKPVIEEKETKDEITREEIVQKASSTLLEENVEDINENIVANENKFLKLSKNEKSIATLEAMIFSLVQPSWFFTNSKIVIDSEGIDENTKYLTFGELNKNLLKNKCGDIHIFAYDEVWNNGEDYVLRTRYYIK